MVEVAGPTPVQTTAAEVHEPLAPHAASEPDFFGLDASMWVALAMLTVFIILFWKKVPGAIGKALDKKIGAIRDQLAEAEALRKDAQALQAEYAAKAASAEGEAASIVERARHEAEAILAKATADANGLVERRGRMAEEKIAAEERAAVGQLRATAAEAARAAAMRLIAERHDARSDAPLIDEAIASIRNG